MKKRCLLGVRHGKSIRTSVRDQPVLCPLDRVKRQFKAGPFEYRIFTSVAICQRFIYGAFAIDVSARRIVGACKSDAAHRDQLVPHNDKDLQYALYGTLGRGRHRTDQQ